MNTEAKTEKIDVKKLLGNPKITFVCGAPGSGKGTQCAKLVEEFGYTHISTGDLMRQEMAKGSRDGDRIRQLVDQGKLVPLELTVNVLVNAMVAKPSQNYLIDGFPRAVEQATYFETNVLEAQNVLFFDCSEETCIDRCIGRAATSGRSDDNKDTILKRFQAFNEQSRGVIDFYNKFGKVRFIDANRDPVTVYDDTRKAMLPQVFCMIGPKASGKTTLGQKVCERTNMKLLDFDKFVTDNKLCDLGDEEVTMALIKHLSGEICPRVLIENFPKSQFQAKFFIKNCVKPSCVFSLQCSKDVCQERMTERCQGDEGYQSSAILAKKIRQYNENSVQLLPYLKEATNLKTICSEQILSTSFEQLCGCIEPTILLIRPSGNDKAVAARHDIVAQLTSTQGYVELNVHTLIKDENERHTEIGNQILDLVSAGKPISNDLIVGMLRKIIYSGVEGRDKFILTDFPESREQCSEFEETCARIKKIFFTSGSTDKLELVENALADDSIESIFKKSNRLTTIPCWNETTFKESLGERTEWVLVRGQGLSGKTDTCKMISGLTKGKIITWSAIATAILPRLETEEGPFEGRVPDAEVEKDLLKLVAADKAKGESYQYIFDGLYHESAAAGWKFLCMNFGAPQCLITTSANQKEIDARFKVSKEMGAEDEIGEEDRAALDEAAKKETDDAAAIADLIAGDNVNKLCLDTTTSKETLLEEVRSHFCVKVVIVNHEKRLAVDIVCANLAIKYNMLYLSVYQLIKKEIESCSAIGKELMLSKKPKSMAFGSGDELANAAEDEDEKNYSAVHFDQDLVMKLILKKIKECRTDQKFILLEGICNSGRLAEAENRLELRFMDEFFAIEQNIGEVAAVISLTSDEDATEFDKEKEVEEPVEEEVKEEQPKPAEGEEAEQEPPAEGEEGEKKAPEWKPTSFRWTVTNGRPRNLPQLCRDYAGNRFNPDTKNWKHYQVATHHEAVTRALDEFCLRLTDENNNMMIYQQVIFKDD